MKSSSCVLILIAGPNGSGKTTFYEKVLAPSGSRSPFVNPDRIAREAFGAQAERHAYAAAQMADEERRRLVNARKSFIMETVLSDPAGAKLKFLREARQAGYFVSVHFLGLDSAQLAIARVAQRVEAGGHDVPDDKILTRYPRTLANLRSLLDLADEVTLYDNSYLDQPFRPVAFLREGRLLDLARSVPSWTATLGLEGRIGPHTRRSWP